MWWKRKKTKAGTDEYTSQKRAYLEIKINIFGKKFSEHYTKYRNTFKITIFSIVWVAALLLLCIFFLFPNDTDEENIKNVKQRIDQLEPEEKMSKLYDLTKEKQVELIPWHHFYSYVVNPLANVVRQYSSINRTGNRFFEFNDDFEYRLVSARSFQIIISEDGSGFYFKDKGNNWSLRKVNLGELHPLYSRSDLYLYSPNDDAAIESSGKGIIGLISSDGTYKTYSLPKSEESSYDYMGRINGKLFFQLHKYGFNPKEGIQFSDLHDQESQLRLETLIISDNDIFSVFENSGEAYILKYIRDKTSDVSTTVVMRQDNVYGVDTNGKTLPLNYEEFLVEKGIWEPGLPNFNSSYASLFRLNNEKFRLKILDGPSFSDVYIPQTYNLKAGNRVNLKEIMQVAFQPDRLLIEAKDYFGRSYLVFIPFTVPTHNYTIGSPRNGLILKTNDDYNQLIKIDTLRTQIVQIDTLLDSKFDLYYNGSKLYSVNFVDKNHSKIIIYSVKDGNFFPLEIKGKPFVLTNYFDDIEMSRTENSFSFLGIIGKDLATVLVSPEKEKDPFEFIGPINWPNYAFQVEVKTNWSAVVSMLALLTTIYICGLFLIYESRPPAKENESLQDIFSRVPTFAERYNQLLSTMKQLKAQSYVMLFGGIILGMLGVTIYYLIIHDFSGTGLKWSDPSAILGLSGRIAIIVFIESLSIFLIKQFRVSFNEYKLFYSVYLRLLSIAHAMELKDENMPDHEFMEKLRDKLLEENTKLYYGQAKDGEMKNAIGDMISKLVDKAPGKG